MFLGNVALVSSVHWFSCGHFVYIQFIHFVSLNKCDLAEVDLAQLAAVMGPLSSFTAGFCPFTCPE